MHCALPHPLVWLSALSLVGSALAAEPETAEPPPFEEDIVAFEAADRDEPPAPGQVLFVGSSSIRLWDLERSFPGLDALNRGFGGSRMADLLRVMDRVVLPYRPRAIVLYEGDNDIAGGTAPEEVLAQTREFLTRVGDALPETPVYVLAVKHSPSREEQWERQRALNAGLARLAEEGFPMAHFVDTAEVLRYDDGTVRTGVYLDDRLHLSPRGYELWTELLLATVGPEWDDSGEQGEPR